MTPTFPSDQATRDRFISEVDKNFSVIAPAGVGKTKAIVDRVVAIATGPHAKDWLPKLIVVTYTKKAADEMHQRARNAIIERKVDLATLSQFNRAFFGTIHSFCVKLLKSHGHLIGLPGAIDAIEDTDEIWAAFVRQLDVVAPDFPMIGKQQCLRFQSLEKILKLARRIRRDNAIATIPPFGEFAMPRLDVLFAHQAKGNAKIGVERTKENLRRWKKLCESDAPFVPMPECSTKAKEFVALWENAFAPLDAWIKNASWRIAISVAQEFRAYRVAKGQLTYDDQIDLTLDLVRDIHAGVRLRAENSRVILDEAQDADPAQFNILLELAKSELNSPPAAGRFCMVGDPQQSIYGSRADLAHYAAVRKKLLRENAAEEINFDVTFRCDRSIIDAVNTLAAPMLDGENGQAEFYKLQARPNAGPGQVVRIEPPPIPPKNEDKKPGVDEIAFHEARQLARWIREQGLEKFGANLWSDVAILCPRRRWLTPIQQALHEENLIPQLHSDCAIRGDAPAYAWFTALVAIMANPDDTFEVVGVLREIFGISDDALARFARSDGERFQIETTDNTDVTDSDLESVSSVKSVVRRLSEIRNEIVSMPLRDAMHRLVGATSLRERLTAIDAETEEIDSLLAQASIVESNGDSLADFAEMLRDGFEAELPNRPVQENAVQLITCHMAKGLQWEAVILPMMFRSISTVADYPAVLQGGPGQLPRVVFSSDDVGDLDEVLELKRRQETQRLLYVAMTRAKKTLVLVDDRHLISRKKPNDSFADLLGLIDKDGNVIFNKFWENLPAELIAPGREKKSAAEKIELDLPQLDGKELVTAAEKSSAGPSRVLPYALAETQHDLERDERRDEPRPDDAEAARLYGIWWHELMESLDWHAPDTHEKIVKEHLVRCPRPERGAREWKIFCDANLMIRLISSAAIVHREMPFLFNRSAREWMEGVMDLAIFYPSENRWLILDWKTNLVAPDQVDSLRGLYSPQLGAYSEALGAITGMNVETGIYSTATGAWIPM